MGSFRAEDCAHPGGCFLQVRGIHSAAEGSEAGAGVWIGGDWATANRFLTPFLKSICLEEIKGTW
jgi:hypothetical protein